MLNNFVVLCTECETYLAGPGVSCLFTLNEGETAHFILRQDPAEAELVSAPPPSLSNAVRSDRAPIVEREGKDGINIKTAKFDLAQYDPLLNEKLVQSLQDSVRCLAFAMPSICTDPFSLLDGRVLVLLDVSHGQLRISTRTDITYFKSTIQVPWSLAGICA